jgi:hypothetical protein
MRRRVVFAVIGVVVVALVAAVPLWGHLRENRADGLAVKWGAAASKGEATLADRCVGVMHEDFATTDDPGAAGLGEEAFAAMVPEICELGVERSLISDDGTMSEESGAELTRVVIGRMGEERIKTINFSDLAVNRYQLAKPGRVTRWHRCVAMAYSGWDAQPEQAAAEATKLFRLASRTACTAGVKRGIVPESGAPTVGSQAANELTGLILATMDDLSQR